jgi:hypothetical protein
LYVHILLTIMFICHWCQMLLQHLDVIGLALYTFVPKHYKITLVWSYSHFVNSQGNIILDALNSLLDEVYTSNNKNITHEQINANWYFFSTDRNLFFYLPSFDLYFLASFLHLSAPFLYFFIQDVCSSQFSFNL